MKSRLVFRSAALGSCVALAGALVATVGLAQDGSAVAPQIQAVSQAQAAPAPPGAPGGEGRPEGKKDDKPKRFPDPADVLKDMKPIEGMFTLYRYDPDDKDRDNQKLLCKIPRALLGEDLLFATSISSGGPMTGFMWNDWLIRFEVVGNQLKIAVPDVRYVRDEGKPVGDAVKRTYTGGFIAVTPIVTMSPQGEPIIDLGNLLKSNLADVSFMGGNVRPELSTWGKIKNFPDNVLIDVELALLGGAPGSGGRTAGVSYAFQKLPKNSGYKPRIADDRIGYFLTARQDWSKPAESREITERYINRWHLEKRDPSLDLSPPKKPIMFVIEKTVPIQWRRWVRDGITEWNKAFEKIGFVDAVVAQQQTDDNEFASIDPEDSRYNFFRWIVSGRAFAMGPSRADPRTGQLLDADIIMDDSFIRAWMGDLDIFAPSSMAAFKGPGFALFQQQYPELVPHFLRGADPTFETDRDVALRNQMFDAGHEQLCGQHGRHVCMYAHGMTQQLALGRLAAMATSTGKKIPEHLLGEAIKEVVAHEVGHTLGLRHNFKASSWLSMDEIKRRRNETDEATTGSVMDYNPLLFFAEDKIENVRHFITPTIGPYDYLAIEYGYKIPGKGDKGEEEMLKEIAGRTNKPGLEYATDEDTMGSFSPDPKVNRYDMSDDPIAYAQSRVALCDKLGENLRDWAIKDGEPNNYLTEAFDNIFFEKGRNFDYVVRQIGGQYFNRDRKGDPDARPPFVLVDPKTQREALKTLANTLLRDDFFNVSPAILNYLAPTRFSDWATNPPIRLDYPTHARIVQMQMMVVMDLCQPVVLQRIYDAELKSEGPDRFTAAELIVGTRDAIFPQLDKPASASYSDAQPMISSISRNLQREYLNLMLAIAQSPPGQGMSSDLHAMVRYALQELSGKIAATLKGEKSKLDFATRAHLSECQSRIDRVLNAQFSAR